MLPLASAVTPAQGPSEGPGSVEGCFPRGRALELCLFWHVPLLAERARCLLGDRTEPRNESTALRCGEPPVAAAEVGGEILGAGLLFP